MGLVLGACVLAVCTLLGARPARPSLRSGLTLPGPLLQDSWRFAFFADGRGGQGVPQRHHLDGIAASFPWCSCSGLAMRTYSGSFA
jgi:hypothetical protein